MYQIYISIMNLFSGAQLYYTWDENTENLKTQKSKDHNQGHLSLSMTKRGKPKLKRKMSVTQLIKIRVKFKRNLENFCLFQITLLTTMITRDSFPVFLYWYFTDQDYLCHTQFCFKLNMSSTSLFLYSFLLMYNTFYKIAVHLIWRLSIV